MEKLKKFLEAEDRYLSTETVGMFNGQYFLKIRKIPAWLSTYCALNCNAV